MKKSRQQIIELIKVIIALIVLSGGVFLLGSMVLISGIQSIIQARESIKWPVVKGVIVQSKVDVRTGKSTSGNRDRSDSSYSYTAMIKYRYEVDESIITGDNVSWAKGTNEWIVKKMVKKYPLNKKVEVHYDPDNPKISVLEPGYHNDLLLTPILGLIAIAIASLIGVLIWKFGDEYADGLLRLSGLVLLVVFAIYWMIKFFSSV